MKNVLFIIHNMYVWHTIENVYYELCKIANVKVVAAISDSMTKKHEAYLSSVINELTKRNIKFDVIQNSNTSKAVKDYLKANKIDIIIRQSPWCQDLPRGFNAKNLTDYKNVYIPYHVLDILENVEYNNTLIELTQKYHLICDRIYCLSENQLNVAKQTPEIADKCVFLGNTRLEYIRNAALAHNTNNSKINLLYTPHHSIHRVKFNFGTFHKYCVDLLNFVNDNKHIELKIRMHPLLHNNMQRTKFVDTYNQFNELLSKTDNAHIDTNVDYIDSFNWSDVLLIDGISFIAEYPFTNKPMILLNTRKHTPFNINGQYASNCGVKANSIKDVEHLLLNEYNILKQKCAICFTDYKSIINTNNAASNIANDIIRI